MSKRLQLRIEDSTTLGDLAEFIHKARKHKLTNKSVLVITSAHTGLTMDRDPNEVSVVVLTEKGE